MFRCYYFQECHVQIYWYLINMMLIPSLLLGCSLVKGSWMLLSCCNFLYYDLAHDIAHMFLFYSQPQVRNHHHHHHLGTVSMKHEIFSWAFLLRILWKIFFFNWLSSFWWFKALKSHYTMWLANKHSLTGMHSVWYWNLGTYSTTIGISVGDI